MRLEALIFDVDGTLAETEELHRQAFNETFAGRDLGWDWSRSDYRRLLMTTGGKERIARHMADLGLDGASLDIPAMHRAKTDRYTALMAAGSLGLRHGIAQLIDDARAAGLRVAIATTTSRPNVDALCAATFGVPAEEIFAAIACGDEVSAKKPSPEVYELALERLNLEPSQAVAFEDSTNGVRSALGAGLPCIVTPSVYTDGDDFTGALAVVDSVADLGGIERIRRLVESAPVRAGVEP